MEASQITDTVLMIRPTNFRKNEQTSEDNFFQKSSQLININTLAQREFDSFVTKLQNAGIKIVQTDDTNADTPDSIFPNNWVSFHADGEVILYPMYAVNRRAERRLDILDKIMQAGYMIQNISDYSPFELQNLFLEGTGSLIFDRCHKKLYCALSERCHETLVRRFAEEFRWKAITFTAYQTVQNQRKRIYHTNVMMSIGIHYALICLDSIDDLAEREKVETELLADGMEIVDITEEQVNQFAGNILQLQGKNGPIIAMSQSALNSLNEKQKRQLSKHGEIIAADLNVIETCGGGSARCVLAEIFLPKKSNTVT